MTKRGLIRMHIGPLACLFALATLIQAHPARAHHSFATHYDASNIVEISGILTEVKIRNPHSFFQVEVTNEDGSKEKWNVEAHAVALLRRLGIDRKTLVPGDPITVRGPRSRRPEKNLLFGAQLKTADGREFEMLESIRRPPETRVTDPSQAKGLERFAGRWLTYISGQKISGSPLPLNETGLAARAAFDPRNTPAMECIPSNLPALLMIPYIYEITVTDAEVTFFHEYDAIPRPVRLDRNTTNKTRPGFGRRRGWLEGDTIVVETTDFPKLRAGLASGWEPNGNGADVPSSEHKHFLERYTVSADGNELSVEYTVKDPVYLYEPYVSTITWHRVPEDTPLFGFDCDAEIASRSTRNAVPLNRDRVNN